MGNLTAEEIVKITLGIIGISFLIYLSVSLVGIFTYKTASEQAKANLEELTNLVSSLEPNKYEDFLITGPQNWFMQELNQTVCFCKEDYCTLGQLKLDGCKECICKELPKKITFNLDSNYASQKNINWISCDLESRVYETTAPEMMGAQTLQSANKNPEQECLFIAKVPISLNISLAK